ncbi:MAG: hypothetical protein BWK80_21795 [Desulfobacteraceae bacterium IS3]|nr:MAG: hypothetical protein BWK80_21795 [Desulfobacteraceae bacterium IS3]
MSQGSFEKVGTSSERMYGTRKIALCGYAISEHRVFIQMLESNKLTPLPLVFAEDAELEKSLGDIMALPDQYGIGKDSHIPRAVILSGITEEELHIIMKAYRGLGLPKPLWAVLTPVSESWTLNELLEELTSESKALNDSKR